MTFNEAQIDDSASARLLPPSSTEPSLSSPAGQLGPYPVANQHAETKADVVGFLISVLQWPLLAVALLCRVVVVPILGIAHAIYVIVRELVNGVKHAPSAIGDWLVNPRYDGAGELWTFFALLNFAVGFVCIAFTIAYRGPTYVGMRLFIYVAAWSRYTHGFRSVLRGLGYKNSWRDPAVDFLCSVSDITIPVVLALFEHLVTSKGG
ncbi:hypothetical protein EXIGLDRAFT_828647 [Exidia glandulosa HHB12029]|uniref:Uncharacterized protein n=1 Tax=Exidia glandulosa HHB12029 TaxID=1314781 RepID=A0A165Q9L1_EXIGL|nr:hypothetical protein EXIGLDRAFT_828647 [Exidia glandulosa HHB12029]